MKLLDDAEAPKEIMRLREIMCSQVMNSDERWERLIECAFYLILRVPARWVDSARGLLIEAEKRRDWWWRLDGWRADA